jgi:hypothetical protein
VNRPEGLWRDPSTATGVALLPGPGRARVERVEDLPDWRVEIHGFWSAAAAIFFCQGLAAAGGNAVAFHREAGTSLGKFVVLARFSDDRAAGADPVEAVPFVEHPNPGEDGAVVARHLKERCAQDAAERAARAAAVAGAVDALAAAGVKAEAGRWGCDLVIDAGAADADGSTDCAADLRDGAWVVREHLPPEAVMDDPRVAGPLGEMERDGWSLDREEMRLAHPAVGADGLAALVARLAALRRGLAEAVGAIRREAVAAEAERETRRKKAEAAQRSRARRAAAREGREAASVGGVAAAMLARRAVRAAVDGAGRVGFNPAPVHDTDGPGWEWGAPLPEDEHGALLQEAFRLSGRVKGTRRVHLGGRAFRLTWLVRGGLFLREDE